MVSQFYDFMLYGSKKITNSPWKNLLRKVRHYTSTTHTKIIQKTQYPKIRENYAYEIIRTQSNTRQTTLFLKAPPKTYTYIIFTERRRKEFHFPLSRLPSASIPQVSVLTQIKYTFFPFFFSPTKNLSSSRRRHGHWLSTHERKVLLIFVIA